MNQHVNAEKTEATPVLTRYQIIKGLNKLGKTDLKSIFSLWITTKLRADRKVDTLDQKGEEVLKTDIEYRIQKLEKDLEKISKRAVIIKWVDGFMDSKITPLQEAQLEISYFLRHPNRMKWSVHQMNRVSDKLDIEKETMTFKIAHHISNALSPYFSKLVFAARDGENMWVRIAIFQSSLSAQSYPKVYIVYRPATNYFLSSYIRPDIKPFIFQALSEVFNLSSIDLISLTGHDPRSLLDLTLNQFSQGQITKYRHNRVDPNPLNINQSLPIYVPPNYVAKEPLPRTVIDEDRLSKGIKKLKIVHEFGQDLQPEFNTLNIKMDLPYLALSKPNHLSPTTSAVKKIPFRMQIKIDGNNVLEGLKILSQTSSLPKFLTDLHSQRTNDLSIEPEDDFRKL